ITDLTVRQPRRDVTHTLIELCERQNGLFTPLIRQEYVGAVVRLLRGSITKYVDEGSEGWRPTRVEHLSDPPSRAALRLLTLSVVSGRFGRRWICKYGSGGESDPEPLLELHQEENRSGRIHPETSELRVRADAIGWRLKGPGQIRHAPIEDLGFAGI